MKIFISIVINFIYRIFSSSFIDVAGRRMHFVANTNNFRDRLPILIPSNENHIYLTRIVKYDAIVTFSLTKSFTFLIFIYLFDIFNLMVEITSYFFFSIFNLIH